jgi:hypothetical protein
MWLIVCLSVRRTRFEANKKTSKMKNTRIQRASIRGLQSFLFKAMWQVSLNILHLYFSIYSVVVVLHAYVNERTPMIGLTRINLSFLEVLVLG